jgi:hypothetical protein
MTNIDARLQAMHLALTFYSGKKTFVEIEKRAEEIYQFIIKL